MIVTMAANSMPARKNFANQSGTSLRYPTQHKKSRPNSFSCKNLQKPHSVCFNSQRIIVPFAVIYDSGKCLHLEIIFHIDGHSIEQLHSTASSAPQGQKTRP